VENVQALHWQLSVLGKAIHYKNLSGAASHVGLSQPQLSRIVARLEEELGVILLDRTARRKSGWTPIAYKVAETYFTNSRRLTQALQQLTTESVVSHLSIGALEGLLPLAIEVCRQLFEQAKLHLIELNVYDLSELEEHFEKEELDLIFTFREPGKHKFRFNQTLGYQILQKKGTGKKTRVYSSFEFASLKRLPTAQRPVLLSNSLGVRKIWIEDCGGSGTLPSPVLPKKQSDSDMPVLMIASDMFSPSLWQKIERFNL